MSDTARVLIDLLILFAAAKLAGALFERARQPAVIGELLAGALVGPGLLGWVRPGAPLETVATLGATVLMFAVGLETRPTDLFRVGGRAAVVGTLGVALPLAAGWGFARAVGFASMEALFIGTALVATSVGITARVLADLGLLTSDEARIVLAAAVIDDVLGMVVLSTTVGLARGGVDVAHLALLLVQVTAFIAFELLVAPRLVNRHAHLLDRIPIPFAPLAVALALMLALAALAEWIGLAGIVGAFFAGMMFAETDDRFALTTQIRPFSEVLVPLFFAVTGTLLTGEFLHQPRVLAVGAVLVVIAVATKVLGCGAGAIRGGWRSALAVGVGMVPRGEVGLIVASVGYRMHVVGSDVYAIVLLVVVATTLIAPPLIAATFPRATMARTRSLAEKTAADA